MWRDESSDEVWAGGEFCSVSSSDLEKTYPAVYGTVLTFACKVKQGRQVTAVRQSRILDTQLVKEFVNKRFRCAVPVSYFLSSRMNSKWS